MQSIIDFIIKLILQLIVLFGCWQIAKPLIDEYLRRVHTNIRFSIKNRFESLGSKLNSVKDQNKVYAHFDRMLYLTKKDYQTGITTVRFIISLTLLFISTLIISFVLIGQVPQQLTFGNPFQQGITTTQGDAKIVWQYPALVTVIVTALPYIVLRYQYIKKSIQSSYDLIEVVKLLSKYSHYSLDVAFEKTSNLLSEQNALKRPARILSVMMTSYTNRKELMQEANRFALAVNSTFSKDLAINILHFERQGNKYLKDYLLRLYQDMEQQRSSMIRIKQSTRDNITMGLYGNLITLLISVVVLVFYLGWHVYLRLQFQTKLGLTFFVLIVISFFIAFVIALMMSKPKLDY